MPNFFALHVVLTVINESKYFFQSKVKGLFLLIVFRKWNFSISLNCLLDSVYCFIEFFGLFCSYSLNSESIAFKKVLHVYLTYATCSDLNCCLSKAYKVTLENHRQRGVVFDFKVLFVTLL